MKVDISEFFTLKIAALLHDPPHKAYLIVKGKEYEEEVKRIASRIFGEWVFKYIKDERVKDADVLASSFDRWLLNRLIVDEYIHVLFPVREIKLKNILEPLLEVSIKYPEDFNKEIYGDGDSYVALLRNVISKVSDIRQKYHLFYAFYELLWMFKNLPIGPAEVCVPTHTTFDHDYAVVAMTNWKIERKGVRGLLVGLDVAGVRHFIVSSRKLRDLWASSYVVSALTWYAIAELVKKLGPDVVLIPSLRMNPFYLHLLKKQPWVTQDLRRLLSKLEDLIYVSDDLKRMYQELGIPPYPLIPGRVTLVLPPWDYVKEVLNLGEEEDIKYYFEKRFTEGWKLLWDILKKYAEKKAKDDIVWKFVDKIFKAYEKQGFSKAGFHEKSPLKIRVGFVKIENNNVSCLFYDKKYRELVIMLTKEKYIRKNSSIELALHNLTRKTFDDNVKLGEPRFSSKGFDYCTVCSKLPALVILPRREEDYKKCMEEFLREQLSNYDLEKLVIIFSPGEKLCPWCFLKRIIGLEPRVLEALIVAIPRHEKEVNEFVKRLISKSIEAVFGFPSVSHIASARLYEKMANEEKIISIAPKVTLGKYLPLRLESEIKVKWAWRFMRRITENLENIIRNKMSKEDRMCVYTIFSLSPEDMWFHPERRNAWKELFSREDMFRYLWRYYALIRGDGDSIGDLLEGKLTAFLLGLISEDFYYKLKYNKFSDEEKRAVREYLKRYIVYSCEGEYRRFINKCLEVAEGASKDILDEFTNKIVIAGRSKFTNRSAWNQVNKIIEELKRVIDDELRIPVTPAYHIAVSSAIMRVALLDVALVVECDGIIIYAGGDDLLAIAPIDKALDIIRESRLLFGGFGNKSIGQHVIVGEKPGFIKLRNAYFSMLGGACKSYSIYIAHYHYPLSHVINRSMDILKEAKKMELEYYGEHRVQKVMKDVLMLAYNPRGGEKCSLIPLSWNRPIVEGGRNNIKKIALLVKLMNDMLKYIDDRFCENTMCVVLSHSFLYDFLKPNCRRIITELRERLQDPYLALDAKTTIIKLVKDIIKRNIRARKSRDEKERLVSKIWEEVFEPMFKDVSLGRWKVAPEDTEKNLYEKLVLQNFIKAISLVRSGMR